jgi:hypothetical protein
MRIDTIGNDGITVCREPPAAVSEEEMRRIKRGIARRSGRIGPRPSTRPDLAAPVRRFAANPTIEQHAQRCDEAERLI